MDAGGVWRNGFIAPSVLLFVRAHWTAALVTLCAAILGAGCALAFARARPVLRVLLLTALICLLALPAPPPPALTASVHEGLSIAGAMGRALALVALFCIPSAAAIPPGLRRAALSAGATPLRAWRDAIFAQIWLPAALGLLAAWVRP